MKEEPKPLAELPVWALEYGSSNTTPQLMFIQSQNSNVLWQALSGSQ